MKTYKKPYSRVISLDTEDVMQMKQLGGGSFERIDNTKARATMIETGGYTSGTNVVGGGAIIEGDSKGWDCWE